MTRHVCLQECPSMNSQGSGNKACYRRRQTWRQLSIGVSQNSCSDLSSLKELCVFEAESLWHLSQGAMLMRNTWWGTFACKGCLWTHKEVETKLVTREDRREDSWVLNCHKTPVQICLVSRSFVSLKQKVCDIWVKVQRWCAIHDEACLLTRDVYELTRKWKESLLQEKTDVKTVE